MEEVLEVQNTINESEEDLPPMEVQSEDIDFCQSCGDKFFLEDLIVNNNNKKICKNCNNPSYYRTNYNGLIKQEG